MGQQNQRYSFSILQWILLLTSGLTILVTLSISTILYFHGKHSIQFLVDKLVGELKERILNTTGSYVNTGVTPLRMIQLLGASDLFAGSDLEEARKALKTLLTENPQFASAKFLDQAGNFLKIGYRDDGSFYVVCMVNAEDERVLYEEDAHGQLTRITDRSRVRWAERFVPNETEWFHAAQAPGGISLTQVYFDEESGAPIFSCAAQVMNGNGDDHAKSVLAIDFGIERLSEFLGNSAYFSEAQAFVLDESGSLVAFPMGEDGQSVPFSKRETDSDGHPFYRLLKPSEFGEAEGRELMQAVLSDFRSPEVNPNQARTFDFEISVGRSKYFISAFNLGETRRNQTPWKWQVFIVIPESVFLQTMRENLFITVNVGLCVLIISMFVGYLYSNRLAKPIIETTNEMEKIKDFRLGDVDYETSFIREVTSMNRSLENMKAGLRSFEKYVPSGLVRQLIQMGKEATLGGETVDLTVFFSDVVDFTNKSELMDTDQLVKNLSHYLGVSSEIIEESGGTIDKFIGDAVMAFWGAPSQMSNKPMEAACLAALEIQARLKEAVELGESNFEVRIGIHCGKAIVGNIGSADRMNYTALGDSINLASRLEGLNKEYGSLICISEPVYEEVKDVVEARILDRVIVKGKTESIRVYEVVAAKGKASDVQRSWMRNYEAGFDAYCQRDWERALGLFKNCLSQVPTDQASALMIERCETLLASPPESTWEPVYKLSHK